MSATIHKLHTKRVAASKPIPLNEALNDLSDYEYYHYLRAHPNSWDSFDRDFMGAEAELYEPEEGEPERPSLIARLWSSLRRA